jgi:hypothetical protein
MGETDDLELYIRHWQAAFGEQLSREAAETQRQAETEFYAALKSGWTPDDWRGLGDDRFRRLANRGWP